MGEEDGSGEGICKQAESKERNSWPREAVKCIISSLKHRALAAPALPRQQPVRQWQTEDEGQGKVRPARLLLGVRPGNARGGAACPPAVLRLLEATDHHAQAGSLELKGSWKHKSQPAAATMPKAGGCPDDLSHGNGY